MSPADAYAEVTNKRVQMLKTMWLREQPAQAAPVQSAQGQGSAADITGEYPGWYDNKYAENANVVIKKSGEDEYEVEVTRVGNPDSGVNSWCNFQGKGRLQKNILQATGISEADGKRYILSIHFRNNNIIEILDENGDLRANFCGGPGFLDGKYKKK
jgi:hypothetical protein